MKILHVAESIKGGVGTYLNHVVPPQIDELGYDRIRVIVPAQHTIQIPAINSSCVRTFDRPNRSAGSLRNLYREIAREVLVFDPDVIHAHSTFSGAIVRSAFAFRKKSPKIVYCPHGWVFHTNLGKLGVIAAEQAERALARFCDVVVAISNFEAREGERIGIPRLKLQVVHNGLPTTAPAPIPVGWSDPRLKVLFIGRLDRQKGLDILLDAVGSLTNEVHVRVVGEAILSDAERLRAPSNVEMMGWRIEPEIESLLQDCDLVIMPSRWEGFGLVALEAMRAERAVLASAIGGLPEVVEDGVTGRLFSVGDVEAIRKTLLSISKKELRAMGAAGRARFMSNFSIDMTHRALMDLYAALSAK
jgi:glycosyltransferase involved in cell wall biosynthesis